MTRYDLDVMNVNLMRKRYPYWYWGAMTMKTYGTKADYNFIHQANAKCAIRFRFQRNTWRGETEFFASTSSSTETTTGFAIYHLANQSLTFSVFRGDTGAVVTGTFGTLTTDYAPHTVIINWDQSLASGNAICYLDGVQFGSALDKTANAPATGDSTFLPTLGCKNDGTGGYNSCFKGVIDGFRVLRGVWMDANGCII